MTTRRQYTASCQDATRVAQERDARIANTQLVLLAAAPQKWSVRQEKVG
ncbi:MAG: hypothetical protein IPM54_09405 [Polyangiaceae bacterium]|nr:hypothetical protein [Polyangiaceae bacterium]